MSRDKHSSLVLSVNEVYNVAEITFLSGATDRQVRYLLKTKLSSICPSRITVCEAMEILIAMELRAKLVTFLDTQRALFQFRTAFPHPGLEDRIRQGWFLAMTTTEIQFFCGSHAVVDFSRQVSGPVTLCDLSAIYFDLARFTSGRRKQ